MVHWNSMECALSPVAQEKIQVRPLTCITVEALWLRLQAGLLWAMALEAWKDSMG